MRCSQARDRLTALVDSDSSDREADEHVASCSACASFNDLVKGADAVLGSLGPCSVPSGLAERAADAALRAGTRATPPESFVDRLLAVAWPAAALAVATAVLLLFTARGFSAVAPSEVVLVEDPVAAVTALPLDLADPTRALIGGGE